MHARSGRVGKLGLLLRRTLLILLGLIAILAIFIVYRLAPVFLDYHFMVTTARQMLYSGAAERMSESQIRNDFAATMRLNHIQSYESGNLSVTRHSGATQLVFEYHIDMELLPGLELSLTLNEDIP